MPAADSAKANSAPAKANSAPAKANSAPAKANSAPAKANSAPPKSRQQSSRSAKCGYPPSRSRPMTMQDLAKASNRSRRGDDADNPIRRYNYDKHRERVLSAKPFVDTSSPIVVRNTYTSPANFNRSITNFVRIERENARMLEQIAIIMKNPPTVDNRLQQSSHSINVRSKAREMNLLRIAFDNLEMWKRIEAVRATYDRKQQLKDYEEAEKVMELTSYYPLFWKISSSSAYEGLKGQAIANAKANPKPTVFLDLETDEEALGQIVIELRADVVPMTAENFRCLCTGEQGLSYKCSEIHRIVPDILWQGGDVVGRDGRGGKSIYGDSFVDENFKLKHKEPGTVSMSNCGKDTNGSQFIITANKLTALDGVNVVVGKVVSGLEVLQSLNDFVSKSGISKKKVWIANCGSADGNDEEEEEEGGRGGGGRYGQQGIEDQSENEPTPPTTAYEAESSGNEE